LTTYISQRSTATDYTDIKEGDSFNLSFLHRSVLNVMVKKKLLHFYKTQK